MKQVIELGNGIRISTHKTDFLYDNRVTIDFSTITDQISIDMDPADAEELLIKLEATLK